MNMAAQIFSERLLKAIGWTILHSLWQAVLVALALGVLLVLLKKYSSGIRYFVAVMAQTAVLLLAAITFFSYYITVSEPATAMLPAPNSPEMARWAASFVAGDAAVSPVAEEADPWAVMSSFIDYFNRHLPFVVTIWLLGASLLLLRFTGSVVWVQRLRHYNNRPLATAWQNKAEEIALYMGVSRAIVVLESAAVSVPVVIGHLKPVILLPLGAVSGLTPRQVESVLAHEIAHIARNDYLVNILQSVTDILFFFNPAHWWISGLVRSEREHCCDDMAVSFQQEPFCFARALTQLELMRAGKQMAGNPPLAMALFGKKGRLFKRVQRLLNHTHSNPTFREGFMAALVLMASITLTSFGFSSGATTGNGQEQPATVAESPHGKPLPEQSSGKKPAADNVQPRQATTDTSAANPANNPSATGFGLATASGQQNHTAFVSTGSYSGLALPGNGQATAVRGEITISKQLDDGRYLFARLDADKKIIDLFVEGKKVPRRQYDLYRPVIEKELERQQKGIAGYRLNAPAFPVTILRNVPADLAPYAGFLDAATVPEVEVLVPSPLQAPVFGDSLFVNFFDKGAYDSLMQASEKLRSLQMEKQQEKRELLRQMQRLKREVYRQQRQQTDSLQRYFRHLQDSLGVGSFYLPRMPAAPAVDLPMSDFNMEVLEQMQLNAEETAEIVREKVERHQQELQQYIEGLNTAAMDAQRKAFVAHEEVARAREQAGQTVRALQEVVEEMQADGSLEISGAITHVELNENRQLLRINGKKQPDEVYERYLLLLRLRLGSHEEGKININWKR